MTKVLVTKDVLTNISNNVLKHWEAKVYDIIDLVVKKNHDYGDAWQRYSIYTPLIRINDKILRVANLSGKEALVADENITDTLQDIVGYALLALEYLRVNPEVGTGAQLPLFPEQKLEMISKIVDKDDEDDEEDWN